MIHRLFAIPVAAVTITLAGCGGSQPPIGAPGAITQTFATAADADRGTSWMLPEAKSAELLYLSDDVHGLVYVLSYPRGDLVGTLTGFKSPAGECVDPAGDVWITDSVLAEIVEYAHASTQPIATLSGDGEVTGCAIDTSTGNLAVTSYYPSVIAVYQNAQGNPTIYSSSAFDGFEAITFDDRGDLFADSYNAGVLAELPKGSGELQTVMLNENLVAGSMQWDGADLAILGYIQASARKAGVHPLRERGPLQLYRVSVSGSSGTIISESLLKAPGNWMYHNVAQLWLTPNSKAIVGPQLYGDPKRLGELTWSYPGGGNPTGKIRLPRRDNPWGTVISPAAK